MWATGVILYAMLHGELPFKGANNYEVIEAIKEGRFKVNKKITKELSEECLDVISKCLDKNPQTRLTMEELLHHPWISKDMFIREKIEKEPEVEK